MWKYEETRNFGFFPWPEYFFQVYSILCIVSLYKYSKDSSGGANTVIDYESANSYPLNIIRSAIMVF